jgi:hypothetical protein
VDETSIFRVVVVGTRQFEQMARAVGVS